MSRVFVFATITFLPALAAAQAGPTRSLLDKYCVACHNQKLKTAGLMLDQAGLGRLDEYLEDIREIERRLNNAAKASEQSPDAQVPFGIPESFSEHINLIWDLQALAFQADITRVATLMYAHDVSMRSYPESGVSTGNHAASHHGEASKRVEDWAKINRYHVQSLVHFLDKLKSTPDGNGNLLDHTLILWATNMGNSNLHSHKDVPHMLIGGG